MNSVDTSRHSGINCFIKVLLFLYVLLCFSSCAKEVPHLTVQPPEVEYVTASWYGHEFQGKPTASGEYFNLNDMTCAHKYFPFGTKLRVTNVINNKSVIVTVNDRGPFVLGRDLELSYAAAKKIGLINPGVGRVKIEHIRRNKDYAKETDLAVPESETAPSQPAEPKTFSSELPESTTPSQPAESKTFSSQLPELKTVLPKPPESTVSSIPTEPLKLFTIQLGSFKKESNALDLKRGLEEKYKDVYIAKAYLNGQVLYRVRIGSFISKDSASSFSKKLTKEGYGIFITRKD